MITITATDLKKNLGYYFDKAKTEDVYIAKNNKLEFKLTAVEKRVSDEDSFANLFGTLPIGDYDMKQARVDRAMEKLGYGEYVDK